MTEAETGLEEVKYLILNNLWGVHEAKGFVCKTRQESTRAWISLVHFLEANGCANDYTVWRYETDDEPGWFIKILREPPE